MTLPKALSITEWLEKHGKPSVQDTMFIQLLDKKGKRDYIAPITNLRIINVIHNKSDPGYKLQVKALPGADKQLVKDLRKKIIGNPKKTVTMIVPLTFPDKITPPCSITINMTDDPTVTDTESWTSFGHSRLIYQLTSAQVQHTTIGLAFKGLFSQWHFQRHTPER